MDKPIKPNITIPAQFAANGTKTDFDDNKIQNGFDRLQPDVLAGDNLNKLIDDTYKGVNYALALGDYIDTKADKDLTNTGMITNCILEAPNGTVTFSGNRITIKQGIKYLTGNGRIASLNFKTVEHVLKQDLFLDYNGAGNIACVYVINGVPAYCPLQDVYYIDNDPSVFTPVANTNNNQIWFDLWNNDVYHSNYGSNQWVKVTDLIIIGKIYESSPNVIGVIRSALPVELLQRKDKEEISGWGMPSDKFQKLSLGSTGLQYTALANGYFYLHCFMRGGDGGVFMYNTSKMQQGIISGTYMRMRNNASGMLLYPVKKGSITQLDYDNSLDITFDSKLNFGFVYAEGEV